MNLLNNELEMTSHLKGVINKYTTYVSLYLFRATYSLCMESNIILFSKANPFPVLYRVI
jgi:hypothetical protein